MEKTIGIEGMMCPHCEKRAKQALEAVPGVEEARTSHKDNNAVLTLSADVSDDKLRAAVEAAGYKFIG